MNAKKLIIISCLVAIIMQIYCLKQLKAEIIFYQEASIEDLWNKYIGIISVPSDSVQQHAVEQNVYRIVGNKNQEITDVISLEWKFKNITYQIYYENQTVMAKDLYQLAIHAKDIDNTVSLERFQRGVQGFHYSIKQVCDWLNDPKTEHLNNNLYDYLIKDGVIIDNNGKVVPSERFIHILGVAYNSKRKMVSVASHEIYHILWDEDDTVKEYYTTIWNTYTVDEKNLIISGLKGYSLENEAQLIEEWAVREMEKSIQ